MLPLTMAEWIVDQRCHKALSFDVNGKESIKKCISLLMDACTNLLNNRNVLEHAETVPFEDLNIRSANISNRVLLMCLATRCCLVSQSRILFQSNSFCDVDLPPAFSFLILAEKLKSRFSNPDLFDKLIFLTVNYLHIHGFDKNNYQATYQKFSNLFNNKTFLSTLSYENYVVDVMNILSTLNKSLYLPFLTEIQDRLNSNLSNLTAEVYEDEVCGTINKFVNNQPCSNIPKISYSSLEATMQPLCNNVIRNECNLPEENSNSNQQFCNTQLELNNIEPIHGLVQLQNASKVQEDVSNSTTPLVCSSNFDLSQEYTCPIANDTLPSFIKPSKNSYKVCTKSRVSLRRDIPKYISVEKLFRHKWTLEQDSFIIKGVKKYGFSWTTISKRFLPEKTNIQIKDRWRTLLQKKLVTMDDKSNKITNVDSCYEPYV